MSYIHNNCVSKAQYWSMYNKFKGDEYYIESRTLRLENKLLKDTIIDLESKLNLHPTPSSPLVVNQDKSTNDKPNQVIFSRGSQINNGDSTMKPVEMKPIINRCQAIRKSTGNQCDQDFRKMGGPILNGYCEYHFKHR